MKENPAHLKMLEEWLRSYKPEELFDATGRLIPELKALAPKGTRRMSANPHANGGLLRKALRMPDFQDYALALESPGKVTAENTRPLGKFLRDIMSENMSNFRVFRPMKTPPTSWMTFIKPARKLGWRIIYPRMPTEVSCRRMVA